MQNKNVKTTTEDIMYFLIVILLYNIYPQYNIIDKITVLSIRFVYILSLE